MQEVFKTEGNFEKIQILIFNKKAVFQFLELFHSGEQQTMFYE